MKLIVYLIGLCLGIIIPYLIYLFYTNFNLIDFKSDFFFEKYFIIINLVCAELSIILFLFFKVKNIGKNLQNKSIGKKIKFYLFMIITVLGLAPSGLLTAIYFIIYCFVIFSLFLEGKPINFEFDKLEFASHVLFPTVQMVLLLFTVLITMTGKIQKIKSPLAGVSEA